MNVALAVASLSLVALTGCAGTLATDAHSATQAAILTLDSPATRAEIADVATAAVGAARDKALDGDTEKRLRSLTASEGAQVRAELVRTRDAALDPSAVRPIVRAAIDEALSETTLGEVDAVRERLVGAPLRADIDSAADELGPRLAASVNAGLATERTAADAEIAKYRGALYEAGAVVALLVALHVHAVWALRRARA